MMNLTTILDTPVYQVVKLVSETEYKKEYFVSIKVHAAKNDLEACCMILVAVIRKLEALGVPMKRVDFGLSQTGMMLKINGYNIVNDYWLSYRIQRIYHAYRMLRLTPFVSRYVDKAPLWNDSIMFDLYSANFSTSSRIVQGVVHPVRLFDKHFVIKQAENDEDVPFFYYMTEWTQNTRNIDKICDYGISDSVSAMEFGTVFCQYYKKDVVGLIIPQRDVIYHLLRKLPLLMSKIENWRKELWKPNGRMSNRLYAMAQQEVKSQK